MNIADIEKRIEDVPNFPKPGIVFKDLTPLFLEPDVVKYLVEQLAIPYLNKGITKVIGVESRGFILGTMLAQQLNAGFVICRKPGKLPRSVRSITYDLEYGTDTLEIHTQDITESDVVLIHDDVLATGGTAAAVSSLVEQSGATIIGFSFICELGFLNGRQKLNQHVVSALIHF